MLSTDNSDETESATLNVQPSRQAYYCCSKSTPAAFKEATHTHHWRDGKRNARSEQKFPICWNKVSDQRFCLLDFVPRRLTTSQQMWAGLMPSTSQCVDQPSDCHLVSLKSHPSAILWSTWPSDLTRSFTLTDIDVDFTGPFSSTANRCVRGQKTQRVSSVPRAQAC